MKKKIVFGLCFIMAVSFITQPASATVTFNKTGTSEKGVDVEFEAQLTIVGDDLTIELFNYSLESLNPDDLLSSFYFDIVNGVGVRPSLAYGTALGDVWIDNLTTGMNNPDVLLDEDADLKATLAGDDTWQFRDYGAEMQPPTPSTVTGGFGLGTVGNGGVDNNFSGNVVGTIDYSIYVGEIDVPNLGNVELVKDSAIFTFSGVSGYTESDIVDLYAFGLGTAPDSLLIPEPATLAILGLGSLALLRRKH